MKRLGTNYHWRIKDCPNQGHVDGYCYLHHPTVMLAKLNYQLRAGRQVFRPGSATAPDLKSQIKEQESLLAGINRQSTP